MMKHLIKLQQDSKTDENTLTQFRFTMHTQMMKTSAAYPNVNSQISSCSCCWKVGNVSNWGWLFVFPSVHLHVNFCCPFLKLWLLDLWQQCRHWIKGTTQFWSVDTEMGKKRSRSINSKVPSDESLDLKQQGGTSDLDLWLVVSWLHILVWLHYGSILWPSS